MNVGGTPVTFYEMNLLSSLIKNLPVSQFSYSYFLQKCFPSQQIIKELIDPKSS